MVEMSYLVPVYAVPQGLAMMIDIWKIGSRTYSKKAVLFGASAIRDVSSSENLLNTHAETLFTAIVESSFHVANLQRAGIG
jgi:hypothetical protein